MGFLRKNQQKYQQPAPAPEPQEMPQSDIVQETAASIQTQELLSGGQTPFAKFLYSPGETPKGVEQVQVLLNKVLPLSNLHSDKDVAYTMAHVDDFCTDYKLWTPKRLQTKEMYKMFNQMRLYSFLQLQRATGGKDRDRALLTTVSSFQDKPMPMRKRSFLGKLRDSVV